MTNFDVYLADAKTVAIAGHVRPDGEVYEAFGRDFE